MVPSAGSARPQLNRGLMTSARASSIFCSMVFSSGRSYGRRAPAALRAFFDNVEPTTLAILFDFAHDLVRKVCNPRLRGGKLFRDHALEIHPAAGRHGRSLALLLR